MVYASLLAIRFFKTCWFHSTVC